MIDTQQRVEIFSSVWKQGGLAVTGLVLTAACAAMAFGPFDPVEPGRLKQIIGYAGLIFFLPILAMHLLRTATLRGPVITFAPEGFRDTRLAAEFIPWVAIADLSLWRQTRQKFLILDVDHDVESGLTLTRVVRWSRGLNRAFGMHGLWVTPVGLRIGFDELVSFANAYWMAAKVRQETKQEAIGMSLTGKEVER